MFPLSMGLGERENKMLIKILYLILVIYSVISISVISHELCHVLCARLLGIKVKEVKIGAGNVYLLNSRNVIITPFIIAGSVDFDSESLKHRSVACAMGLGSSGCIGNIIVIVLSTFLPLKMGIWIWIVLFNASSILVSILPVWVDNDMRMTISLIKEKKQCH